jgi:hypothetical protein
MDHSAIHATAHHLRASGDTEDVVVRAGVEWGAGYEYRTLVRMHT